MMNGKLVDITVDNSICIVQIELDNEKVITCYAETNPFIRSIDDAFDNEWQNKQIDFELDSNGLMIWFNPSD